jgi:hypothetical protein
LLLLTELADLQAYFMLRQDELEHKIKDIPEN